MLSLEQLTNPPTRSEVATWLKTTLSELGFSTTGWQEGRIQLTLLNAVASTAAGVAQLASTIAEFGFNSLASGAGLTLYSESRYSNTRTEAAYATGDFLLTNAATVPYSIVAGQLIVTDTIGTQFTNTEGGTLTAGGTLDLEFRAIIAGADGNIGNESTLELVTPLAGVTVTNPGPGDDVAWYTVTTGADPESDTELKQRNATKWGTLSTLKTSTAVENLALAQDGVEKVYVNATNPRGQFTVDVYVSASSALLSTGQITDAQEAFAENTFGTESAWPVTDTPITSVFALFHPTPLTLNIEGVVYYDSSFTETEVADNLRARLLALVQSVPIGGKSYSSSVTNTLTLGDILEAIERTRGVVSVTLTSPTGDIALSPTNLLVPPGDWITGLITLQVAT